MNSAAGAGLKKKKKAQNAETDALTKQTLKFMQMWTELNSEIIHAHMLYKQTVPCFTRT